MLITFNLWGLTSNIVFEGARLQKFLKYLEQPSHFTNEVTKPRELT